MTKLEILKQIIRKKKYNLIRQYVKEYINRYPELYENLPAIFIGIVWENSVKYKRIKVIPNNNNYIYEVPDLKEHIDIMNDERTVYQSLHTVYNSNIMTKEYYSKNILNQGHYASDFDKVIYYPINDIELEKNKQFDKLNEELINYNIEERENEM